MREVAEHPELQPLSKAHPAVLEYVHSAPVAAPAHAVKYHMVWGSAVDKAVYAFVLVQEQANERNGVDEDFTKFYVSLIILW